MAFDPFETARGIDILDLIENKYGLEVFKSGRILFASCPKSDSDSNPSLAIYQGENRFHCYHCGDWSGTPIDFVMGMEGFRAPSDALRHLDKLYPGLGLISTDGRSRAELVAKYFEFTESQVVEDLQRLKDSAQMMEWVRTKRGFSEAAIDRFRIGVKMMNGVPRLSIPIMGSSGKVHGFVTRQMSPLDPMPRYYTRNVRIHPKTGMMLKKDEVVADSIPVYTKGEMLHNLEQIKSRDIVLVEGQLDDVAAWELGVDNVAAVGTKVLTDLQAEQLGRFDSVTLIPDIGAFDSVFDNTKVIRIFHPQMPVKVVDLSSWKDHAKDVNDLLLYLAEMNDPGLFKTMVNRAIIVEQFLYGSQIVPLLDNEAKAIEETARILKICTAPVARVKFVQLASEGLGLPADLLLQSR
jgi:hypothetical protein